MARLPATINQQIINPYSGGAWLWVCQIIVPGQTTQYLARNTEDLDCDGTVYTKHNFDASGMIWSSDGSIPRVTLRVAQDRTHTIEKIINDTYGALGGEIKLFRVNEDYLDESISALEADYDVLATESDEEWVTFTLGFPNPLVSSMPKRCYSASGCPFATPTLFKGPECGYAGADTTCTGTYTACLAKSNAARWGGDLGLDPNGLVL